MLSVTFRHEVKYGQPSREFMKFAVGFNVKKKYVKQATMSVNIFNSPRCEEMFYNSFVKRNYEIQKRFAGFPLPTESVPMRDKNDVPTSLTCKTNHLGRRAFR